MWKLQKAQGNDSLVLFLSGRIQAGQLAALREILEAETKLQSVVLDLEGLKLVDHGVVAFLALCESHGIRLKNCPGYIREWITRRQSENEEKSSEDTRWN